MRGRLWLMLRVGPPLRRHSHRRVAALLLASGSLLAACNIATFNGDGANQIDGAKETDVLDRVRSIDLLPRYPNQVQQAQPVRDRGKPAIYVGETERASGSAPAPSNAATTPGADASDRSRGGVARISGTLDAR